MRLKISSCKKLVIRLYLPAEAIPYSRQVTWPSAAVAGTTDHGRQETALLRGPGAPRRPDDRRAPAAARDAVADVHARLLWNEWKSAPGSSGQCSDGSCRRAGKMELAPIVKLRLVTLLINRHKSDRICV